MFLRYHDIFDFSDGDWPPSWICTKSQNFIDWGSGGPRHHAKFLQNRSMRCQNIAIFRFFKKAAVTILHFGNQKYLLPRDSYDKRGICRRRVSVCLSVCVSVCVCLSHSGIVSKRRITQTTQTTPHDSPMTLVFWYQRSWRNSNGITPYGGDKCRWGGLKLVTLDEKRAITRKRYKLYRTVQDRCIVSIKVE